MKAKLFLFCLVTVPFSLLSCSHEVSEPYFEVRVDSVVSKDTLKVRFLDYVPDGLQQVVSVRLIGVETPSLKSPENQYATDEPYAAEATAKMRSLCGKTILILFDDKLQYSRGPNGSLYVYAYEEATHGASINESLIRQGYARYWNLGLQLENGKAARFEDAQEQAQFDGVGVWVK